LLHALIAVFSSYQLFTILNNELLKTFRQTIKDSKAFLLVSDFDFSTGRFFQLISAGEVFYLSRFFSFFDELSKVRGGDYFRHFLVVNSNDVKILNLLLMVIKLDKSKLCGFYIKRISKKNQNFFKKIHLFFLQSISTPDFYQ